MAFIQSQPAPIGSINMTPLIDVLLVLLVMFLLALPVMTHKVTLDLPLGGTLAVEAPPPTHRLAIAENGAMSFDGAALAPGALRERLRVIAGHPDRPLLEIAADAEARYERVDQILAEVNRAGVTRIGFVGNNRYADAF